MDSIKCSLLCRCNHPCSTRRANEPIIGMHDVLCMYVRLAQAYCLEPLDAHIFGTRRFQKPHFFFCTLLLGYYTYLHILGHPLFPVWFFGFVFGSGVLALAIVYYFLRINNLGYLESRGLCFQNSHLVMAENQGRPPSPDINEEDRVYLHARQNPNQIANRITRGTQRLGYYTVVCFLLNRIIGNIRGRQDNYGLRS